MAVKNDGKVRGNISLGDKSPSINGVPATAKVVASFHTHTPMTEIKGKKRKAGPSKEDKENADKNKIPIDIFVGVNLAVSFSCIVGCPICKIYLVDHGYRNFKEKIHFME